MPNIDLIRLPHQIDNLDIDPPIVRRWQALFYLLHNLTPWGNDLPKDAHMSLCDDVWIMCCGCVVDEEWGDLLIATGAAAETTDRFGRRALAAGDRKLLWEMLGMAWHELLSRIRDTDPANIAFLVPPRKETHHE